MPRWKDDPEKVEAAKAALDETYGGPWGPKASEEDAVFSVAKAVGLDVDFARDREWLSALAEKVWEWKSDEPSPLAEGLGALVTDGLRPGSTVPVAEIAGDLESASWDDRYAKFVLDAIEAAGPPEGGSA